MPLVPCASPTHERALLRPAPGPAVPTPPCPRLRRRWTPSGSASATTRASPRLSGAPPPSSLSPPSVALSLTVFFPISSSQSLPLNLFLSISSSPSLHLSISPSISPAPLCISFGPLHAAVRLTPSACRRGDKKLLQLVHFRIEPLRSLARERRSGPLSPPRRPSHARAPPRRSAGARPPPRLSAPRAARRAQHFWRCSRQTRLSRATRSGHATARGSRRGRFQWATLGACCRGRRGRQRSGSTCGGWRARGGQRSHGRRRRRCVSGS